MRYLKVHCSCAHLLPFPTAGIQPLPQSNDLTSGQAVSGEFFPSPVQSSALTILHGEVRPRCWHVVYHWRGQPFRSWGHCMLNSKKVPLCHTIMLKICNKWTLKLQKCQNLAIMCSHVNTVETHDLRFPMGLKYFWPLTPSGLRFAQHCWSLHVALTTVVYIPTSRALNCTLTSWGQCIYILQDYHSC